MRKNITSNETIKDITRVEDGIVYRYVLTAGKSKKVASYQLPLYSIEVIMTKDGRVTRNSVNDVFSDIGKALSFFEQISRNLATPIDLTYVLEDKISL